MRRERLSVKAKHKKNWGKGDTLDTKTKLLINTTVAKLKMRI